MFPSICRLPLRTLDHLVVVELYIDNSICLDRLHNHALEVNR